MSLDLPPLWHHVPVEKLRRWQIVPALCGVSFVSSCFVLSQSPLSYTGWFSLFSVCFIEDVHSLVKLLAHEDSSINVSLYMFWNLNEAALDGFREL